MLLRREEEHCVSKAGQQRFPCVNQIGGERDVREWNFALYKRFRMALLPAVRSDQIGAINRAIDGDFALGPAVNRADLFDLGGPIWLGTPFVADWTDFFVSHSWSRRTNLAVRSWISSNFIQCER